MVGLTAPASSAWVAAWGDSLTQGPPGGTPWPYQLQFLTNRFVYNGGVGGDTCEMIAQRFGADTNKHSWPTVIWAGSNNYADDFATVKSCVDGMVAQLGTAKYLILSLENNSGWTIGTTIYNALVAVNGQLAAAYPNNYLDIRQVIVNSYNPAIPQDVIDHAEDVPPSSLRYDQIHLLTPGYAIVAQQVQAYMQAHGW